MDIREILKKVDHTLLGVTAGWGDIEQILIDAEKFGTASACIPPAFVKRAKDYVGDRVKICTVIGFPNGYNTTAAKVFETADAVANGADEIDMVINVGELKSGNTVYVENEIKAVRAACEGKILKVIIETCLLTENEKITMCDIVTRSGADYIKTSTGFSTGGATFDDIKLFSEHIGSNVKMKAQAASAALTTPRDSYPSAATGSARAELSSSPRVLMRPDIERRVNMSTAHNTANKGDFAKTVIMPGDPLRAKYIAETFLDDARLVNNVRGIQGYTGTYHGKPVSVMASGMGMPSMGIYSYELFNFYDVDNIIRVGSAGGIAPSLKLRDVVIGAGACTNSNFAHQFGLPGAFAPIASFSLLEKAVAAARKLGKEPVVGNIVSSDTFYEDIPSFELWQKMGVLAVEMEAAALYMNAARSGKNALCICTISDLPMDPTSGECSPAEREQSFDEMIKIALNTL